MMSKWKAYDAAKMSNEDTRACTPAQGETHDDLAHIFLGGWKRRGKEGGGNREGTGREGGGKREGRV